jgi:hypothetical protein
VTAVPVPRDDIGEPVGARQRAEEEEDEDEMARRSPLRSDRLELAYETASAGESPTGTMPRAMSLSSTAIGRTSLW